MDVDAGDGHRTYRAIDIDFDPTALAIDGALPKTVADTQRHLPGQYRNTSAALLRRLRVRHVPPGKWRVCEHLVELIPRRAHLLQAQGIGTGIGQPFQATAPLGSTDAVHVCGNDPQTRRATHGRRPYVVVTWNSIPTHSNSSSTPRPYPKVPGTFNSKVSSKVRSSLTTVLIGSCSKCPEPFLSVATKRDSCMTAPGSTNSGAVPEMVMGAPAGALVLLIVAVPPQPTTFGVFVKPARRSCLLVNCTDCAEPLAAAVESPVVVNWNWKPTNSGEKES